MAPQPAAKDEAAVRFTKSWFVRRWRLELSMAVKLRDIENSSAKLSNNDWFSWTIHYWRVLMPGWNCWRPSGLLTPRRTVCSRFWIKRFLSQKARLKRSADLSISSKETRHGHIMTKNQSFTPCKYLWTMGFLIYLSISELCSILTHQNAPRSAKWNLSAPSPTTGCPVQHQKSDPLTLCAMASARRGGNILLIALWLWNKVVPRTVS